jgi:hypothetical protein
MGRIHNYPISDKSRASRLHLVFLAQLLFVGISPALLTAAPQSASQSPSTRSDDSANKAPDQSHDASRENALGLQTIKNIVRDQRQIWTSPAHVRLGHADWLIPYAGLTAGFLVTDRDASLHLSNSPSTLKHFRDFSN